MAAGRLRVGNPSGLIRNGFAWICRPSVQLPVSFSTGKMLLRQAMIYKFHPIGRVVDNCISVTGNTQGWHTNTFAAQTGRYVRLNGTSRTTPYGYSLYDMQVYGTVINSNPGAAPARPNLALNKPATASSTESGGLYPANLAVDGNDTTRWGSAFVSPQWIYVDLGATNPIDTVVINWQDAAAKAYYIAVANNTNCP